MQPELHVDPNIYHKNFPRFDKPKVIGYIGLENIKFIKKLKNDQNVSYDLNLLIEKAIHKPEDHDEKLTELLKFLYDHRIRLNFQKPINNLEQSLIFCYRGLMTCVASTPFEHREPWIIVALLYKGNIYLCARDTEQKKARKRNMTDQEKKFTSWGYKFEQFILSDSPGSDPNPNLPLNENDEFSLVFQTKLNQHHIVYGAEMDGINCDSGCVPPPPTSDDNPEHIVEYLRTKEFVELKTSRHIEYHNQDRNFRRFKTLKWWCQSFLVGIDSICCGFRNDSGIVEELRLYKVRDLPKMSQRYWNPNVCFNFLDTFFTFVKRSLAREIEIKYGSVHLNNISKLPLISLQFEWKPGSPVQVLGSYRNEDDPILPHWYLDTNETHTQECGMNLLSN